ncbi:hypothetical protein ASC70_12310 [Caulobacter sp. Root343]|nr:hypothetical protein ASC70_12310 [Caulobacter sp. Root343]
MSERSHRQILEDAGGVTPVRRQLASVGIDLPDPTVRSWPLGGEGAGSIPPEYWPSLVQLKIATLEELARAAEARKFPELAAERRAVISEEGAAA